MFLSLRIKVCKSYNLFSILRSFSHSELLGEHLNNSVKHKIEEKYKTEINKFNENKDGENFYVLSMFPYPSGSLHMGHVRVYTISDTLARYYAMNGKKVFQPMGWDAFGLPAENAAIENKVNPKTWTESNIKEMKKQMSGFGCKFNWESELATCDKSYYKWTQALFLDLYTSGLLYRKESFVNWDSIDNTVLAEEQVDENGFSWRSGAKVEKRLLNQWFIRTTQFAKRLYDGLSDPILEDWKDIINLQKHWIGDCNGYSFDWKVVPLDDEGGNDFANVWIHKDHVEDLVHSKYICVKSSNVLVKKYKKSNNSPILVHLENPFTNENLPVFINDSLEYDLGRDIKTCIPHLDEAQLAFAKDNNIDVTLNSNTKKWTKDQMCTYAVERKIGGYAVSSKLRDWLISRQRYWGTPIPIIYCTLCGPQPVPYDQLPVELPEIQPDETHSKNHSILKDKKEWYHVKCPSCGHDATRETDTMDTFVDSSWYYARYLDTKNEKEAFNIDKAKEWLPVNLYIGGKEHAVLHLYYARFIGHYLFSQQRVPTREPFKRMLVQGMIMGQTYKEASTGKYLKPNDLIKKGKQILSKETNEKVTTNWEKMSKSKHNGVHPNDLLKEYGIDTTRLFVLSDVAPTSQKNWSDATFPGILNWQIKLWIFIKDFKKYSSNPELIKKYLNETEIEKEEIKLREMRNKTVKAVHYAYHRNQQINSAICRLQSYTGYMRNCPLALMHHSKLYQTYLGELLIMLAPMAPHFSAFLWDSLGLYDNSSLFDIPWPQVDDDCELSLKVYINKRQILEKTIIKKDLLQLKQESVLDLLVTAIKSNESLLSKYQPIVHDLENNRSLSNHEIQFLKDPNNDYTLNILSLA